VNIEQKLLDKVESRLGRQNSIFASLGAAFWVLPALIIWQMAYSYNPNFGPVMLLFNGILIGLVVRFVGKGLSRLFSVLAFFTYSWVVFLALSLNIIVGSLIWGVMLFGLFAVGAGIAIYLARIEVPFVEHKAYTYLTSVKVHASNKNLKNRWFIALPILIIASAFMSSIAIIALTLFDDYQNQQKEYEFEQRQRQVSQNQEIDITPDALEKRKSKDILRYAYAYHEGVLFNKNETFDEPYPRSEYKAKTILKYLANERNNARAKFILGLLTEGAKARTLLQEAVDQGDKYAQVYSAVEYGCYTDPDTAKQMLARLRRVSSEKYVLKEIESILYVGFDELCSELAEPKFLWEYVSNYDEYSD
jgi:hypothetical protein